MTHPIIEDLLDSPWTWILSVPVILMGASLASAAEEPTPSQPLVTIAAPNYVVVEATPNSDVPRAVEVDVGQVAETAPPLSLPPLSCGNVHLAEPGDSWWQISARADIDPYQLLDLNRANIETLILIGDPICLPAGTAITVPSSTMPSSANSTVPVPPTTVPEPTSGSTTSLAPSPSPKPSPSLPSNASSRPPLGTNGDCESWRPMLEFYGLKDRSFLGDPNVNHDGIAWRESGCRGDIWIYNTGSRDYSFGLLMANRLGGSMSRWFDAGGYTVAVMKTPEGAIAASAALFEQCGMGPWNKADDYPCYGSYTPVPATNWGDWEDQR